MTDEEKIIYQKAIDTWGKESQLLQAAEECNELSKAIIKYVNDRGSASCIEEETADVEIMLKQLRIMLNERRVNGHKQYKLTKLEDMLAGDNDDRS